MNYESIKHMPRSRDGKMVYGIIAALLARTMLNQGVTMLEQNTDGAFLAFLMAGVMLFTLLLAIVRYDNGRPLFEAF
ncbi:MAG: hypothetical protein V4735_03690 [Pseudomonadota bacterium]